MPASTVLQIGRAHGSTCAELIYFLFGCFFFNETATTDIDTLSLHDVLPIYANVEVSSASLLGTRKVKTGDAGEYRVTDRKSTRLDLRRAHIFFVWLFFF